MPRIADMNPSLHPDARTHAARDSRFTMGDLRTRLRAGRHTTVDRTRRTIQANTVAIRANTVAARRRERACGIPEGGRFTLPARRRPCFLMRTGSFHAIFHSRGYRSGSFRSNAGQFATTHPVSFLPLCGTANAWDRVSWFRITEMVQHGMDPPGSLRVIGRVVSSLRAAIPPRPAPKPARCVLPGDGHSA